MACDLFKPRLAAFVYDDISAEDRVSVEAHLVTCPACAEALARLAATREVLGDAVPEVTRAPRVVLLAPRRRVPTWGAFAAGVAAATVLATGGFLLGSSRNGSEALAVASSPAATGLDAEAARAVAREESRRQFETLFASLDRGPSPDVVTRKVLEAELAKMEGRLNGDRAQEVDYLLGQLQASEARTGNRIGDTQKALRYVALAGNPGLGEY